MPKGLSLILSWKKLQSINRMYIRTKTGVTLSSEARTFKKEVSEQVRDQLPKELPFTRKTPLKLSLHIMLKDRFFVRDASNFVKLVEDTIFDEIGLNDAMNIELDVRKSFLKGSESEYIKVTLEESFFDYDFFNKKDDTTVNEEEEEKSYSRADLEEAYNRGLAEAAKAKDFKTNKTKKMKDSIDSFKKAKNE